VQYEADSFILGFIGSGKDHGDRIILKKSVEFNPAENIQHKLDRPIGGISCI
jgi:hypothetical protein